MLKFFGFVQDSEILWLCGNPLSWVMGLVAIMAIALAWVSELASCGEHASSCTNKTCKGHEVHIMHFSIGNAIPGRTTYISILGCIFCRTFYENVAGVALNSANATIED
ncbi:hypothetical protein K1719_043099 [Acacia pycnantha]|nr:hypothetical protein K1719_043099 [Acacia pycnantha]